MPDHSRPVEARTELEDASANYYLIMSDPGIPEADRVEASDRLERAADQLAELRAELAEAAI